MSANELLLELLASGVARFEPDTNEFCFRGLRYSHHKDWSLLVEVIGKDEIISAIQTRKNQNNENDF